VHWCLQHKSYKKAWLLASEGYKSSKLTLAQRKEVGEMYIHVLLEAGKFDEAGQACGEVLGEKEWEEWRDKVLEFAKVQAVKFVYRHVPIPPDSVREETYGDEAASKNENDGLGKEVFGLMLSQFLDSDHQVDHLNTL
jgi:hypothetical protein